MKKYIVLIILNIIFILSILGYFYFRMSDLQNFEDNIKLKNYMASPKIENITENENTVQEQENEEIITLQKTERMLKLEELQKENSDIIGWLEIYNTNISYPVLQGKDNTYYMKHNYKKQYSKEGSLFLDKDYDWSIPSSNLLIYGHNNIGSNEMFSGLLNYKNKNFYDSHKTIRFTTNEEDSEYEILSIFLSRVYYQTEKNVFRYYYFINSNTKEEFDEYVANCQKASLYETEITAEFGEQLMTLSTCDFYIKDGRLAIVAKKRKKY